jgi:hypothetical protein
MSIKLILLFCLIQFESFGQHMKEITGFVISKEGIPQSNVNIFLVDFNHETTTEKCGRFKILIPSNRNGYLMISDMDYVFDPSDRILPFYFNLKKIKSKDLNKDLIFRLPYPDKKEIDSNCRKEKESKIIRLRESDKHKLKKIKAANNGEHS